MSDSFSKCDILLTHHLVIFVNDFVESFGFYAKKYILMKKNTDRRWIYVST